MKGGIHSECFLTEPPVSEDQVFQVGLDLFLCFFLFFKHIYLKYSYITYPFVFVLTSLTMLVPPNSPMYPTSPRFDDLFFFDYKI